MSVLQPFAYKVIDAKFKALFCCTFATEAQAMLTGALHYTRCSCKVCTNVDELLNGNL